MTASLSDSKLLIAPSLLACDFSRMGEEVARCEEAGADLLHLDLMDGHFVPNLSYGFPVIKALSGSPLPLDAHLMVSNPSDYIERLAELGVYQITVHWEACTHLHRVLHAIKELGMKAGVALNPHSPVSPLRHLLDLVDCILVMTVNPGFGGQSFIRSQLAKVREAREAADSVSRQIRVSVDGGVNGETASHCVEAGADLLVAGSYLFKAPDMKKRIAGMRTQGNDS